MKFIINRLKSFKHALIGWKHVIKTQQNAWIHLIATLVVLVLAFSFSLMNWEWIALLLAIGMVWMAEFLNTALEVIVDLASPDQHPLAKIGKDVGAGAVLITAIFAFIVGSIIFIPHIILLFKPS